MSDMKFAGEARFYAVAKTALQWLEGEKSRRKRCGDESAETSVLHDVVRELSNLLDDMAEKKVELARRKFHVVCGEDVRDSIESSSEDVTELRKTFKLLSCPRCGAAHDVTCMRLRHGRTTSTQNLSTFRWWGTCSKTRQPVLIGYESLEVQP